MRQGTRGTGARDAKPSCTTPYHASAAACSSDTAPNSHAAGWIVLKKAKWNTTAIQAHRPARMAATPRVFSAPRVSGCSSPSAANASASHSTCHGQTASL